MHTSACSRSACCCACAFSALSSCAFASAAALPFSSAAAFLAALALSACQSGRGHVSCMCLGMMKPQPHAGSGNQRTHQTWVADAASHLQLDHALLQLLRRRAVRAAQAGQLSGVRRPERRQLRRMRRAQLGCHRCQRIALCLRCDSARLQGCHGLHAKTGSLEQAWDTSAGL